MLGASAERISGFANIFSKAGKTAVEAVFSPLSYGLELYEDANDLNLLSDCFSAKTAHEKDGARS